eukprot:scaffold17694_cov118-Isochrysis_galbana.AAC.5
MFFGGWPTLALLVSPAALGAPLRPLLRANRACGITATSTALPSSKQASEFPPPITVSDGRTFRVFASESGVSDYIVARTEELMVAAIEAKGAVSLSVGSGTTVKPLTRLAGSKRIDFRCASPAPPEGAGGCEGRLPCRRRALRAGGSGCRCTTFYPLLPPPQSMRRQQQPPPAACTSSSATSGPSAIRPSSAPPGPRPSCSSPVSLRRKSTASVPGVRTQRPRRTSKCCGACPTRLRVSGVCFSGHVVSWEAWGCVGCASLAMWSRGRLG